MSALATRLSTWITKLEELCLAWGILGIAGLTIANVIGRSVFGQSLAFAEELSQTLLLFVTFLGLGYAAGKGRHIRMTALYDALPERARRALRIFICATTALLLFYFAWLGASYSLDTMRELGSVSPALRIPRWIPYLAAPVGFSLAGVQYVLALYKNLTAEGGVWLSFEVDDAHDERPPEGV